MYLCAEFGCLTIDHVGGLSGQRKKQNTITISIIWSGSAES